MIHSKILVLESELKTRPYSNLWGVCIAELLPYMPPLFHDTIVYEILPHITPYYNPDALKLLNKDRSFTYNPESTRFLQWVIESDLDQFLSYESISWKTFISAAAQPVWTPTDLITCINGTTKINVFNIQSTDPWHIMQRTITSLRIHASLDPKASSIVEPSYVDELTLPLGDTIMGLSLINPRGI